MAGRLARMTAANPPRLILLPGMACDAALWQHQLPALQAAAPGPVLVTDGSRNQVGTRTEYEPYGQVPVGGIADRPGYTGHVADALTDMDYMQQRYYDPMIGRFLSTDPVTATNVGGNFNRYWYGNDNLACCRFHRHRV